jgi:magnesium transporter
MAHRRSRKRRTVVPGTAPGSILVDPDAPHPVLKVTAYGPDGLTETTAIDPGSLRGLVGTQPVIWANVDGLGDEATLRQVGDAFGLHRLVLEDVVNVHQRPKAEAYDTGIFVVAHMPSNGSTEQVSFFLGEGFLLTFQERAGDCFDGVRHRLQNEHAVIRRSGADYLCYALLDALIDAYFPVVEKGSDDLEALEEEVLDEVTKGTVSRIHVTKRHLQDLRRIIGPHREVINSLLRDAGAFVKPETMIYLRDCYDHVLRLTERVEVYREQCADLLSTYLSLVSNRMNEVMKVLTIFATVFMPLGFIAGLYGMNFNPSVSRWNMPELNFVFGYPMALGVMALTAIGLVVYFKRKNWL